MKLVLAVVNNDDGAIITSALTNEGFFVTTLSTTGGFLNTGNKTLLIGTEDSKVSQIKELLAKYCSQRTQKKPEIGGGLHNGSITKDIKVGGATYFVLDVSEFGKV